VICIGYYDEKGELHATRIAPAADWEIARPVPVKHPRPETAAPAPRPPITVQLNLSDIDHLLQRLATGNVAFNTPKTMTLEETYGLYLLLSPTKSIQELEQEIQQRIAGNQALEGATIKIAPQMEARLTGQDFEIKAVTPEVLAVSGKQETRWQWDVTPTKQGIRTLHLTLSAMLSINNSSTLRAIQTFDKTIEVQITVKQRVAGFVAQNWQWLWAVIVVPVGAWLWKRKKRRKPGEVGFRP